MSGKKPLRALAPEVCPVCGEVVPRNALACPGCGADGRSGWREDNLVYDGLAGDEDFDYDGFVREEFGTPIRPRGLPIFWWVAAIVVLVALVVLYLRQGGL